MTFTRDREGTGFYKFAYISLCILLGLIIVVFLPLWHFEMLTYEDWNTQIVIWFLAVGYVIFGFLRTFPEDKIAAIIFLQKPIINIRGGIGFAPPLLSSVRTITANIIHIEIGTLNDKEGQQIRSEILEESGDGTVVLHSKEPFRITFTDPKTLNLEELEEFGNLKITKDDLKGWENVALNRAEITTDPHVILQVRIVDYCAFIHYVGSLPQLQVLLSKHLRSATQAVAGKVTVSIARNNMAIFNSYLHDAIEYLIGEKEGTEDEPVLAPYGMKDLKDRPYWGIDALNTQMSSLGLPYAVNRELANNASQGAKSLATISEGRANGRKIRAEGKGIADARRLLLEAEAVGTKALKDLSGDEKGQFILQLQLIRDAIKGSNYTILPGSEILGAITSVLETARTVGVPRKVVTPPAIVRP